MKSQAIRKYFQGEDVGLPAGDATIGNSSGGCGGREPVGCSCNLSNDITVSQNGLKRYWQRAAANISRDGCELEARNFFVDTGIGRAACSMNKATSALASLPFETYAILSDKAFLYLAEVSTERAGRIHHM
jgi:hypothetical protein